MSRANLHFDAVSGWAGVHSYSSALQVGMSEHTENESDFEQSASQLVSKKAYAQRAKGATPGLRRWQ